MDNDINTLLTDALSSEQTKKLMKYYGFAPNLPYVVEAIQDEMAYSTEDVANLLRFSPGHVARLCRQGVITSFHIKSKSKHRIFGEEIKRFVLSKLTQPAFLQKHLEK